jgi:BASS family bile acid:Na+ symporter
MFDWYPPYEYLCARTQLVLFTLGMGMTLSLSDFVEIARRPRSFVSGLVGQLLLIPLIAVLINWTVNVDAGIAVGMILVGAMPGGALAKFFTYFGRGNMALSISLTGVTTLLTLITVPFLLQLFATQHIQRSVGGEFAMPVADIMIDVALCLLLPLAAGMTISRFYPAQHRLLSRICIRIGLIVVIVMVVGSLGSGRIRPLQHGFIVPLAIILFCLLGAQANMLPFHCFKWPRQDRMAVGIEVTMRNMNLALLINARLFPVSADATLNDLGEGVLFVVLFYAGTAMAIGFPLSWNHRRMARSELSVSESRRLGSEELTSVPSVRRSVV